MGMCVVFAMEGTVTANLVIRAWRRALDVLSPPSRVCGWGLRCCPSRWY
jgi:hypothetical protein